MRRLPSLAGDVTVEVKTEQAPPGRPHAPLGILADGLGLASAPPGGTVDCSADSEEADGGEKDEAVARPVEDSGKHVGDLARVWVIRT